MPTLKLDDINTSTASLGVSSIRRDRAIRRGTITGIGSSANAAEIADAALTELVSSDGLTYPAAAYSSIFGGLPVAEVVAGRIGPDIARVMVIYARGRGGSPTSGTVARKRGGFRSVRVYRQQTSFDANGLPDGDLLMPPNQIRNPLRQPNWGIMTVATAKIIVPYRLATSPFSTVAGRLGTINSGSVTWGGYSFPAHTLRFDSIDEDDVRTVGGTIEYAGTYVFTAQSKPFMIQTPVFDDAVNGTAGQWDTRDDILEYDAESFTSPAFPI